MEFNEVINSRYSCKKYDGRPVPEDVLETILEAGRRAPTAKNQQEHHIYVIRSEEGLKKVDEITPCRYNASTVLAFTYDRNHVYTYPGETMTSGMEDASIVATHIMLAATNAGIDNCWINRFDPAQGEKLLDIPENETLFMFLDLGYAAEGAGPLPNNSIRKELSETVTWI